MATRSGSLGVFDQHQDVGSPRLAGDAVHDPLGQSYALAGAG